MKITSEQRVISVSNNIENLERSRQLSLQKTIDSHYPVKEKYVIVESKMNLQC